MHAAVRVVCALWSGHAGALGVPLQSVGGCCLLSEWRVPFGAGMLVALRVLLQVLPEDGALRGCCQSGVRASNHAFGAGMLVSGWLWKVLLGGTVKLAYWCCCKGSTQCTQLVLQGCW